MILKNLLRDIKTYISTTDYIYDKREIEEQETIEYKIILAG